MPCPRQPHSARLHVADTSTRVWRLRQKLQASLAPAHCNTQLSGCLAMLLGWRSFRSRSAISTPHKSPQPFTQQASLPDETISRTGFTETNLSRWSVVCSLCLHALPVKQAKLTNPQHPDIDRNGLRSSQLHLFARWPQLPGGICS